MFKISINRQWLLAGFLGLSLMFVSLTLPVMAAEFNSGDRVEIVSSSDNLYVAGSNVTMADTQMAANDLVVAGAEVNISGRIGDDLIVAGGVVKVNSPSIGGSVRAAGGTVYLEGVFQEDVIVTAGSLNITKAVIAGDLIVSAGDLVLEDSQITGDFMGSYSSLRGDLEAQVSGNIQKQTVDSGTKDRQLTVTDRLAMVNWSGMLTILIVSLLLARIISQRYAGGDRSLAVGGRMAIDLFSGLGYLIIPFLVVLIAAVISLLPVVGYLSLLPFWFVLAAIIYLGIVLSSVYVPVYLANLFHNMSGSGNMMLWILGIWLVWLGLDILIVFAPILVFLYIFVFFIQLTTFAYLVRKVVQSLDWFLHRRKEYLETVQTKPVTQE